ncbi:methyltransferase domain-containing protein [Streptomyces europaeiscabiei]|uniref:methyltransferase domain-containing protein n=1 Tax=Streptomyces europaeiscabiei TaxID=146819 RepID=UPI0029A2A469|nr:methyltransferase domain-containing protein [Streptomyces europaeiscabiei]MDX3588227.1 methyltransferase domain-containing protein [Streptomyces europaeiscabiei]MDX3618366.1 methyltransferase domain-containing protein [Streptomyces europaeiscabiei]WUD30371.1 methyltransferase domain-containing protein [Streptomyces europaeiscabiei]
MDKRDTDDGDEKAARLADDFHDVDSSGAPGDFIAYLRKAEESESGRLVREATYRPLGAIAGRGADIGCGTGRAVADLTRLGKDVVGVDSSQAMVDAALTRFPHCEVVKGDACDLPFGDGELSWYRSERTFVHLPDPAEALSEASRVLEPGGTIVVADADLDSMVLSSRFPRTTRAVKDAFCSAIPNPHAGTRTADHLTAAGFTDVEVTPVVVVMRDYVSALDLMVEPALTAALRRGSVSEEAATEWTDDLKDMSRRCAFTAASTFFVTTARRGP